MTHTCLCLFLIFSAVSHYEAQKTLMTSPYISYYPYPDTSGIPPPWKSNETWIIYVRALLEVCIRKFLSGIITYLSKTSLCVDRSLNLQNQTEVVKDKEVRTAGRRCFRYAIHKNGPCGTISISVKQNQDDELRTMAVNNQRVTQDADLRLGQGIGFVYKFNFLPLFDVNMTFTLFNLVGMCHFHSKKNPNFEQMHITAEHMITIFCHKRPQWSSFLLSVGCVSYFNVGTRTIATSHIVFQFQVMNAKTIRSQLDTSHLVFANETQITLYLFQTFTCEQDMNKHILLYVLKAAKYQHICLRHTLPPTSVFLVLVGRKKYQILKNKTKLLVNYFHCFFQITERAPENQSHIQYNFINTDVQQKFSLNYTAVRFEGRVCDNVCVYQFATKSLMFAQIEIISMDLQWLNTQTCFFSGVSFFDSLTFYEVLRLCVNISNTTKINEEFLEIYSVPYVAASNLTTLVLHSMEAGNLSVSFTAEAVQCRGVFTSFCENTITYKHEQITIKNQTHDISTENDNECLTFQMGMKYLPGFFAHGQYCPLRLSIALEQHSNRICKTTLNYKYIYNNYYFLRSRYSVTHQGFSVSPYPTERLLETFYFWHGNLSTSDNVEVQQPSPCEKKKYFQHFDNYYFNLHLDILHQTRVRPKSRSIFTNLFEFSLTTDVSFLSEELGHAWASWYFRPDYVIFGESHTFRILNFTHQQCVMKPNKEFAGQAVDLTFAQDWTLCLSKHVRSWVENYILTMSWSAHLRTEDCPLAVAEASTAVCRYYPFLPALNHWVLEITTSLLQYSHKSIVVSLFGVLLSSHLQISKSNCSVDSNFSIEYTWSKHPHFSSWGFTHHLCSVDVLEFPEFELGYHRFTKKDIGTPLYNHHWEDPSYFIPSFGGEEEFINQPSSWIGAHKTCQKNSTCLPSFVSQSEVDKFIRYLKWYSITVEITTIFIGIHSRVRRLQAYMTKTGSLLPCASFLILHSIRGSIFIADNPKEEMDRQ